MQEAFFFLSALAPEALVRINRLVAEAGVESSELLVRLLPLRAQLLVLLNQIGCIGGIRIFMSIVLLAKEASKLLLIIFLKLYLLDRLFIRFNRCWP